jgi:hypothetical protein
MDVPRQVTACSRRSSCRADQDGRLRRLGREDVNDGCGVKSTTGGGTVGTGNLPERRPLRVNAMGADPSLRSGCVVLRNRGRLVDGGPDATGCWGPSSCPSSEWEAGDAEAGFDRLLTRADGCMRACDRCHERESREV